MFHIITPTGISIAKRLIEEGEKVYCYVGLEMYKQAVDIYDFIKPLSDLKYYLKEDDYVIFAENGYGRLGEQLKKEGYKVFGGNLLADKLEGERFWSIDLARSLGVDIPLSLETRDLNELEKFMKDNPLENGYVFKVEDLGSSSSETIVCDDMEESLDVLLDLGKKYEGKDTKWLIQERVIGPELTITDWYHYQYGFTGVVYSTLEQKKPFNGDLGPNVGSEITVMFKYLKEPRLYENIKRMEPVLKASNYVGEIDMGFIITDAGERLLEFTPRLGYCADYGWFDLGLRPLGDIFRAFIDGNYSDYQFSSLWDVLLPVNVYPYPSHSGAKKLYGKRVDIRVSDDINIWREGICKVRGEWIMDGLDTRVLVLSYADVSLKGCFDKLYDEVRNVKVEGEEFYRTDGYEYFRNRIERFPKELRDYILSGKDL